MSRPRESTRPQGGAPHISQVAQNKRARFEYEVLETVEAGLMLRGAEVKSLRAGEAALSDAYAVPKGNELFLINAKFGRYEFATSWGGVDPTRARKLLLHRSEMESLIDRVQRGGLSLIPLALYFKDGKAKVELALCKGRAHEDKRQVIKERETRRELDRAMAPRKAPSVRRSKWEED